MPEVQQCAFSVVIPAFNEADRLPKTLERLDRFFLKAEDLGPVEVVVVDDGSSDRTSEVSDAFRGSGNVTVRVFRHRQNQGKGAAVRTGFWHSRGRHVLLSDADLAAPIAGIRRLIPASGDSTVVIGSRAVDRSLLFDPQPRYRDLMGRTFNLMVRALLLPGIFDTQCGFKLFPGQIARSLSTVQEINGFAYDVELLVVSRLWGLKIVEVGVPWGHVEASRVLPGRHSAQMFRDLLKITLRRWTNALPQEPRGGSSHG
ncbi:MAG: dolichyl-phosphate beta-glucosyltransferase [Acidobacteriota bacterium]